MRFLSIILILMVSGCVSWDTQNEATKIGDKMKIGFAVDSAEWPDGYKIERRKLFEFPPVKYEG